jgi:plastocyanin
MKKPKIIFIILVILVAGAGAYILLNSYLSKNQPKTPIVMIPGEKTKPQSKEKNTVTIQDFKFNPDTLTVKIGDTVTWINEDGAVHTVKSDTFNSQNIKNADSFLLRFTEAGTYEYSCKIHPYMKGKIIVN